MDGQGAGQGQGQGEGKGAYFDRTRLYSVGRLRTVPGGPGLVNGCATMRTADTP